LPGTNDQVDAERTVGEVSNKHAQGILEIKSWDRAGNIEKELRKKFGLFARIFRQENENWVQVAFNDCIGIVSADTTAEKHEFN
jgi:hypothetical protein